MSSEESCHENNENGNSRVVNYSVKKLTWQSKALKKMKKRLDKAYRKRLTKRARDRIVKRINSEEPSERQRPTEGFPEWALKE